MAWDLLGERTPSHTTLHGWTEGLGAHVLGLPGGEAGGVPFSRFVIEAQARVVALAQVVQAPFWVDERRYRSEARRERLAGVAMLFAVARLVTDTPMRAALAQCRRLALVWSNSCVLLFPSRFSCTAIEHRGRLHGPGSRYPPQACRDRCPTPTKSPPGASSRSPPSSMPASTRPSGAWPCASARASPWRGRTEGRPRPIPKSTLYRWLKAYRKHGYLGLLPKVRADRGAPRRADTPVWIGYAIGLLYEQPNRSLTQLEAYLQLEFANYRLSRSSLARHLRAHPAFNGIEKLRKGHKSKLRALYEAQHPHEGWQLDGKGPFTVRLQKEGRVQVHVLSVLDDYSRYALAAQVASSESEQAAMTVFEQAVGKWGLADRFQFDAGSAFGAKGFPPGSGAAGRASQRREGAHPRVAGQDRGLPPLSGALVRQRAPLPGGRRSRAPPAAARGDARAAL